MNGLIIYLIGFALALIIMKYQPIVEELFAEIEAKRKKKQRDTLIESTKGLLDSAEIDKAYCEWQGKSLPIEIELQCDPLNFPKELQGEQCKMVYNTSSSWNYVCETEPF